MSTINPLWLTSTVVDLARSIHDGRHFDRLPILADALMDAGCDNTQMLTDFRTIPPVCRAKTRDGRYAYDRRWSALKQRQLLSLGSIIEAIAETALTPEQRAEREAKRQAEALAAKERAKAAAKAAKAQAAIDAANRIAMAVATRYHSTIYALYTSQRAEIVFGSGGQEDLDWDAYKGRYCPNGRSIPAKWKNAGVRIVGERAAARIVIETSRGTEVARLPMPPRTAHLDIGHGRTTGDIYTIERSILEIRVATRYGVAKTRGSKVHDHYVRTGIAVRLTVPVHLQAEWPVKVNAATGQYWEHGHDVRECRKEFTHKASIAEVAGLAKANAGIATQFADETAVLRDQQDWLATGTAEQERIAAAKRQAKVERASRLLARIGANTTVSYDDARACGACNAGIQAFAQRIGLPLNAKPTLAQIAAVEPTWAVKLARRIVEAKMAVA